MGDKLLFDRIVITEGGRRAELSVPQFLSLPLDKRIGHVLSRTIEFFDGGVAVDRRVALSSLRTADST